MNKSKIESYMFLIVLALIWGSSFILMKKGMLAFSASQVASLRILLAGIVFIPYTIKIFREIPWDKFKYILLFAVLEIGIPPYLYTFAQQHIDSSSAGILNSLVPIFTLSTGILFFKLRYNIVTTLGVLVGLLGAFIIVYAKKMTAGAGMFDFTNSWGLLIAVATLFYGIAGNILMVKLNDVRGSLVTAVSFVSLAIPAGIYLMTTDFFSLPLSEPHYVNSFLAILLLSIFGSALAIVMFSKLIQLSNALFASFVTYLISFVSLIWGWLDSENISIIHFSSLAFIFLGIYLASKGENLNKRKNN